MKYPGNCGRVSALLGLISTVHPAFRLSETRRLKTQPSRPRSMKGMDISNFFTNNDISIIIIWLRNLKFNAKMPAKMI